MRRIVHPTNTQRSNRVSYVHEEQQRAGMYTHTYIGVNVVLILRRSTQPFRRADDPPPVLRPLWPIGEIEDQLDEEEDEDEDEDEVSSAEEEDSESDDDDDEDGSTSSSEVDSVFGSDLDAGDEDLGPLRKSAVRYSSN